MTARTMTSEGAVPVPTGFNAQKFGRIETIRDTGQEVEIRQPDGCLLIAELGDAPVLLGGGAPKLGRNIWVLGRIENGRMQVEAMEVFEQER